jgi:antitoxin component YwqK of YwqJK toxin-antitoxin module
MKMVIKLNVNRIMKKILLILLTIPLIGFGQKEVKKTYYDNGQLKWYFTYLNGFPDGIQKEYYENGQLESEGQYKDRYITGIWKGYYENGQLKYEGNYTDGEKDGMWKRFYENGQLLSKRHYKDGKKNGLYETYYKGKLIESGKYKIGELIYQKCWDRNKKEIKCL